METTDFTVKKLRETLEKLTLKRLEDEAALSKSSEEISGLVKSKKILQDNVEYLENDARDKDTTISQLRKEVKEAQDNLATRGDGALKDIQALKNELVELKKKGETLERVGVEKDQTISKFKKDLDDLNTRYQQSLDDVSRLKEQLDKNVLVLQEKDEAIVKAKTSFEEQLEIIKLQTDDKVQNLNALLEERQSQNEHDRRDYEKINDQLKAEANAAIVRLTEELNHANKCVRESRGAHEKESAEQKLEIHQLEKILSKLEGDVAQKDDAIKNLQSTIKENRDFLYKDSEFDLVVAKLKAVRLENKNLKLENLKLLEDNDKLTYDVICLQRNHDVERDGIF